MIRTEKINKVKVKPIVNNITEDITDVKGKELFKNNLSNIYIMARKRSGKSSLIGTILKKMADKRCNVIIFSSTVKIDPCWVEIKKDLEKRGITTLTYTHFIDENKVNILEQFLKDMEGDSEDEKVEDEGNRICGDGTFLKFVPFEKEIKDGNRLTGAEPCKPRKPKTSVPDYIICYDDLSSDLRHSIISSCLKSNRHKKIMNIISSQYLNDLNRPALRNLDYMIMFKGQDDEKLELIHRSLDLGISLEDFEKLYHYAVETPYSFLYIDIRNDEYRKNFNEKIMVKK
jgi:hypothetical protein